MIFLIPIIYVIVHQPSGDQWRTYDGMSESTVRALVAESGLSYEIVDEKTFHNFADKNKFVPKIDPIDPIKAQAILDANNTSKTAQERIDALIKAIDLK